MQSSTFKHYYIRSLVNLRAFDRWRKQKMSGTNFLILAAAVVGVLGGLAGALLKLLTHNIEKYLQSIEFGLKFYLLIGFPMIGIFLTVLYVKTFIRKSKFEHGLTQVIYSVSKKQSRLAFHNTYSQIITSALTVGFGGSVGLEAPIAVSGSALGSNTADGIGLNYRDRTLLLACGTAAGIAAVFNSPVAGMVLALELILPAFTIPAFIPLLIASAASTVVAQLVHPDALFVLVPNAWRFEALPFYIVLGLLVGYFCNYFIVMSSWVGAIFKKIKGTYSKLVVGGITLGVFIALFPSLYGEGYITIQALLNQNYGYMLKLSFFEQYINSPFWIVGFAFLTLFGKSIACLVTMQAGGNGGNFGPSLVMGGMLGFVFAYGLNLFFGLDLNITNFVVVGMAACLAGLMHAPLTGIFLIAEITGGYKLMVPLMIACAIAYYINRRHYKYSIYTKNLAEAGDLMSLEDRDKNMLTSISVLQVVDRFCIRFTPESTIEDNMDQILKAKSNTFAVVDAKGTLVGIVTSELLLEEIFKIKKNEESPNLRMSDLAQPAEFFLDEEASLYDAMNQMDRRELRILPVVDQKNNKRFVGLVTKNAIFSRYRKEIDNQAQYL